MLKTIVLEEELEKYLGNDLDSLDGTIRPNVLGKLRRRDAYTTENYYLPLIDYLFLAHQQGNETLRTLSEEVDISLTTMYKIFNFYGLPKLNRAEGTRRKWQDTEFRKRQGEAVSRAWLNPEFRARNAEGVRRNNKDPRSIERRLEGLREKMADPQYIERQAVGARTSLNSMRYEPGFRKRQAAAASRTLHRINQAKRQRQRYHRDKVSELLPYAQEIPDVGYSIKSVKLVDGWLRIIIRDPSSDVYIDDAVEDFQKTIQKGLEEFPYPIGLDFSHEPPVTVIISPASDGRYTRNRAIYFLEAYRTVLTSGPTHK